MIKLRQLLVENPDLAYYNNQGYHYSGQNVIGILSVFQSLQTKKFIGIVASEREGYVSTDDRLNRIMAESEVGFPNEYVNHLEMFEMLQDLFEVGRIRGMSYRKERPDMPVHARIWKSKDKMDIPYLASFWNPRERYFDNRKLTNECFEMLGIDPVNCLYEFIKEPNTWYTYQELQYPAGPKNREISDDLVKKLLKLQHVNPMAKQTLRQIIGKTPLNRLQTLADKTGTTVAALRAASSVDENQLIKEDPDDILLVNPDGGIEHRFHFSDLEDVTAVVCVGEISSNVRKRKIGWFAGVPSNERVFLDEERISYLHYQGSTHSDLEDLLHGYDEYGDPDPDRGIPGFEFRRKVNFRIFERNGMYYIAFWESRWKCKFYKKEILKAIKFFVGNTSPSKIFVQFSEMSDQDLVPLSVGFDIKKKKKIKRTKSKEQAKLDQMLHLMPPEKKAEFLKKLGAMKPNKIQRAADKLGITSIELKQKLGMDERKINETGDVLILEPPHSPTFRRMDWRSPEVHVVFQIVQSIQNETFWEAIDMKKNQLVIDGEIKGRTSADQNTHSDVHRSSRLADPSLQNTNFRIQGRIWEVDKKYYITFWEKKDKIKKYRQKIEECVKYFIGGASMRSALWLPGPDKDFLSYYAVFDETPSKNLISTKEYELEKQLHILPPNEKSRLLKQLGADSPDRLQAAASELDMPVIKLKQLLGMDEQRGELISEVPDDITVGNKYYDYRSPEAVYVFCMAENTSIHLLDGAKTFWAAVDLNTETLYYNGNDVEKIYPTRTAITHGDLFAAIKRRGIRYKNLLSGRAYFINQEWYFIFWTNVDHVKEYKTELSDMMKWMRIDPNFVHYQYNPMQDNEWTDSSTIFGGAGMKTAGSPEEWEKKRQLHLMPPDEKNRILKLLGAMSPDKIKVAADKLGIPAIKLRQLLGMDVAENSLGNLSFSDYHDPSIPYEAKPRIRLGFSYGTLFERLNRKRNRFS